MLTHHCLSPISSNRVFVVGAGGFVGAAATNRSITLGIEVGTIAQQHINEEQIA
jgi:hypothetical protein